MNLKVIFRMDWVKNVIGLVLVVGYVSKDKLSIECELLIEIDFGGW